MTHINRWHRWSWLGGEIWVEPDDPASVLTPGPPSDESLATLIQKLGLDEAAQMEACRLINERIELRAEQRAEFYSLVKHAGNMVHVANVLRTQNQELRSQALHMIWFASRSDDFWTLLTNNSFLQPLIDALTGTDQRDRLLVLRTFANMAVLRENQQLFIKSDVELHKKMMVEHSPSAIYDDVIGILIGRLAVRLENKRLLAETQGVLPLVLSMVQSDDPRRSMVGTTAAANLALGVIEIAEELVAKGILPAVEAMLSHHQLQAGVDWSKAEELDAEVATKLLVAEKAAGLTEVLSFSDQNKRSLLRAEIIRPLVMSVCFGSDHAKAYAASALCNFSLLPENCAPLAEAKAADALRKYLDTAGDFQAAVALYNIVGRDVDSEQRDDLNALLEEKLVVKKVNGIIKKIVEGKEWGDWSLQHISWTLQNLSSFETAKLSIIADKALLDALVSVVRGGVYDRSSKQWAASVLWDVAFHPQLKKADKNRHVKAYKPIHDTLKAYDPAAAARMGGHGARCCAQGTVSSQSKRACSTGDCCVS